jgi:hypothetical protein
MHFQPMPVGLEPCPDLGVLVVGGVVLNENRSLAAVSPGQLFEEAQVLSEMNLCVPRETFSQAANFKETLDERP